MRKLVSSKETRNKKKAPHWFCELSPVLDLELVVKGWEPRVNCDPKDPGQMCVWMNYLIGVEEEEDGSWYQRVPAVVFQTTENHIFL